jgi:hypothetical protein
MALNATLIWTAGSGATSHRVYFGTTSTLGSGQLKSTQSGTTYNPGALAASTTYYWRIDEVNAQGTRTGTIWSFTTASQSSGPSLAANKSTYATGESIVINFANASGDQQDWIGLYAVGAANSTFLRWLYTDGTTTGRAGLVNGAVTFGGGLSGQGNYEGRLFFNDTFTLAAKVAFSVQSGSSLPGPASNPSPIHTASGVSTATTLTWSAGAGATSHKVYFGTSSSLNSGQLKSTQSGTTFNPGTLSSGTTYYWRIDEVNTQGTTIGPVWSFTTIQSSSPAVSASKSSYARGETIVVNFSNASGDAQDWIGLYTVGAANTSFVRWLYTGGTTGGRAGLINGSVSFPGGLTSAGNYQARLFFNDTYQLRASASFTVQP